MSWWRRKWLTRFKHRFTRWCRRRSRSRNSRRRRAGSAGTFFWLESRIRSERIVNSASVGLKVHKNWISRWTRLLEGRTLDLIGTRPPTFDSARKDNSQVPWTQIFSALQSKTRRIEKWTSRMKSWAVSMIRQLLTRRRSSLAKDTFQRCHSRIFQFEKTDYTGQLAVLNTAVAKMFLENKRSQTRAQARAQPSDQESAKSLRRWWWGQSAGPLAVTTLRQTTLKPWAATSGELITGTLPCKVPCPSAPKADRPETG